VREAVQGEPAASGQPISHPRGGLLNLHPPIRESPDGTRKAHSVPAVDEWASPRRD